MSLSGAGVQALVLAAGKGTRLRGAIPKVLQLAAGAPLLEGPLRALEALGVAPIHVAVGAGALTVIGSDALWLSALGEGLGRTGAMPVGVPSRQHPPRTGSTRPSWGSSSVRK